MAHSWLCLPALEEKSDYLCDNIITPTLTSLLCGEISKEKLGTRGEIHMFWN